MKLLFRLLFALFLLLIVGAGFAYWQLLPEKPPVLQAFINANVLTIDDDNAKFEAVLIEGEIISAVGTTKQITSLIQSHPLRSKVRVHDLSGKTLMPGIIDAHSHFPGSGVYEFAADLNAPPIGSIDNINQLQTAMRELADATDGDGWLFGLGYDDTQMQESRHPLREELDAISSSRPIFILHISGHMGVVNSAALRHLGIDENTEPPAGGGYVKNERGTLNGLILETAVLPILKSATDYSFREILAVVRRATLDYASQGITTAQNGAADQRFADGLRWASKFGVVPQRLIVWPLHGEFTETELQEWREHNNSNFELGAVKLVVDGSIQGYTGYLSEPYHIAPKGDLVHGSGSDYRGKPLIERKKLTDLVSAYFASGQRLAIHGNGDAAIDDILYAVDKALKGRSNVDHRTVLVHAQMARKDQLSKMKKLGVTPSFFSAHTYYWGDRHRDIFMGRERAANMSPARSAEKIDLPYTIHLDTPVVPMETMRLLWSAVNRESSSGRIVGRRERISREQALRTITINSAYQIFKEASLGSIEVGKLADLVVLDKDPTDAKIDLLDISISSTFVGGVEIYAR